MNPIEYIGPVPKKKRKKPVFGGFIILLLTGVFISYFAWPAVADYLRNEQDKPTDEETHRMITELKKADFGDKLAAAALERTLAGVTYDGAVYNNIGYPGGDVPVDRGRNTDMVIRAYRTLSIDLQQLVHEDISDHFYEYPQLWNLKHPDANIDHRRVQNLQRYFERNATTLKVTKDQQDYKHGDIIAWRAPSGLPHIGIVVPGPGKHSAEKWVVHNNSDSPNGPEWNDELFDYTVTGHYRFSGK